MRYEDAYPVVFVHDLATTMEFYGRMLGLDVLFQSDFFVLLTLPEKRAAQSDLSSRTTPPRHPTAQRSVPGRARS